MTELDRSGTDGNAGGMTSRTAPKLDHLLGIAAGLMARRGFGRTSIRDVANETGISLGGLYYYFKNKEDLLFLIQERTFGALLELQEAALAEGGDAETRLRRLVRNHLRYFLDHFNELKVCTYELESLEGERYEAIAELRRWYYHRLAEIVAEVWGVPGDRLESDGRVRHATLFVFGMLNWIFTWYDADRDKPVDRLGDEMIALVMDGLRAGPPPERTESS
ncbi:MAG: TetR/AcrR family transcriptional regulator [bacterium]|nr:TetR/AcrR family transcriptional regulator [bacterium]